MVFLLVLIFEMFANIFSSCYRINVQKDTFASKTSSFIQKLIACCMNEQIIFKAISHSSIITQKCEKFTEMALTQ